MKAAEYNQEDDILRLLWSNVPIEESDEVEPGVILDYDKDGNIVGIEVLNASRKIKQLSPLSAKGTHSESSPTSSS